MAIRRCTSAVAALLLAACSITQEVKPIAVAGKAICVIANPKVSQPEFVVAYERELRARGYEVQMLSADSSLIACPLTSTYTANWNWDLALYMSYAELKVYNEGKVVAEAIYDSRRGGGNMGKFIKAEEKIKELVGLMLPKPPN